ncbi:hypothetical protein [Geobacter sp.]|uniref:hypothetical protein n=1 Tax=Geobacter sp. TaxID=46610 RepID=UPI00261AF23C|nr:hypothetical protein [Geobacter sp.]
MNRKFIFFLFSFVAALPAVVAFAGDIKPVIREEHKISINGVEELWRLEWAQTPSPACGPEDPAWSTCPCTGFAFGESEELTLVRKRQGQKDERLSLTQFFSDEYDSPASSSTSKAVLARWEVHEKDYDDSDKPDFVARVRTRPVMRIMNFKDYDHDGNSTEFMLQVGTLPCGKLMSIIVGISSKNPHLHVFSSVRQPKQPLTLQARQEALRKAKAPIKMKDWQCGDHGSEQEVELELVAQNGNIHATRRTYECKENGRGKLLKKENF